MNISRRDFLVQSSAGAAVLAWGSSHRTQAADEQAPVPAGRETQLLIDNAIIERHSGHGGFATSLLSQQEPRVSRDHISRHASSVMKCRS